MPVYTLPDLPYDYAALEPHISGRIMELHHDKHHATYVAGANAALDALAQARESGDLGAVNLHEKNLAFNLGGHINHTVFWNNLSPDGGGEPDGTGSYVDLGQQHVGDGFRQNSLLGDSDFDDGDGPGLGALASNIAPVIVSSVGTFVLADDGLWGGNRPDGESDVAVLTLPEDMPDAELGGSFAPD